MGWAKESRITPATAAVDRYFELCVLGLVASGYLALLGSGFLDPASSLLAGIPLLGRTLLILGIVRFEVPERIANWLLLGYFGVYLLDGAFLSRDFFQATVHLVFYTAGLKLLAAKRPRDYVLVSITAFVAILSAAVLSANLTFFICLTLFVVFAVAALACAEIRRSIHQPQTVSRGGVRWFSFRLTAATLWMAFGVFALTGGLFFILPRTAQAAFRHLLPERFHVPGFSNEIRLGGTGEIQNRGTPVMHVRFEENSHPPPGLKFRGMALTQFDGTRWYNPADRGRRLMVDDNHQIQLVGNEQRWRKGQRLNYEVQLSLLQTDALFFAGRPEFIRINSPALIETPFDSYRVGFPLSRGLRYGAQSFLEETAEDPQPFAGELQPEIRNTYLLLPPIDPRIRELARRLTAFAETDEARARAIENFLRRSYGYTTKLLSHEVADPLAYFLFDRKKGHCEYFASAMAVMLRSIGIPARVATGFQSGVYNPVSGWWVIRAEDAHSWVEACLPLRGWTTFDPTPPSDQPSAPSLLSKLSFYMDAADTFWQEWVLDYNLDHQLVLASRMETSSRNWRDSFLNGVSRTAAALGESARRYALAAVVLVFGILGWWLLGSRVVAWSRTVARVRQVQRGQARSSDASLLYERMLHSLKARGFEKPVWVTPAEFACLLPVSETSGLVRNFTSAYNDMRFGGRLDAAPRMVELLEAIERRRA